MTATETAAAEIRLDGRCFTYVFACAWEDFCKIGFSRDPLGRIGTLHPRWFEFFDLDAGALVEAETQRDARDLELALRRPLTLHRAPAPLTIAARAGGKTEWVRGANRELEQAVRELAAGGHRVYPLRAWLRAALLARVDRLHDWSAAHQPWQMAPGSPALIALRDMLDAHAALDIAPEPMLPDEVWAWYQAGR